MNTDTRLLHRLANIAAIRDSEILDLALLRTLNELLPLQELALIRVASDWTVIESLVLTSDGSPVTTAEHPRLDETTLGLLNELRQRDKPEASATTDGSHTSLYPLLDLHGLRSYLKIRAAEPPKDGAQQLILGFVKFFQHYCGLLYESQRDQLTGLCNRKTFDHSAIKLLRMLGTAGSDSPDDLSQPSEERRQDGGEAWLGVVDIDHFKRINDTFGHLYGDEVLLLVAQLMQQAFRSRDLLFRFGGEEFVIIARSTDREGAIAVFDRFRERIAAHHFPQIGTVTVSIGIVQFVPGRLITMLLDEADKALYYAKQNGRNRLAVYEQLVQEGAIVPPAQDAGEVDLF